MACLGFPWISSAPEQHLSWRVHLRPPSPQSQCESGGQNSLVPQSWSDRSVSSSSSAGVSLPHSSPVCAKIHSCSLMVPVSLCCPRPQRALALVPWPPTSHSLRVSQHPGLTRQDGARERRVLGTSAGQERPVSQALRHQQGQGVRWAGRRTALFLRPGTLLGSGIEAPG